MSNVTKLQSAEINELRQEIRILEIALLTTINIGKRLAEGSNIKQEFRIAAWRELDNLKKALLDDRKQPRKTD